MQAYPLVVIKNGPKSSNSVKKNNDIALSAVLVKIKPLNICKIYV